MSIGDKQFHIRGVNENKRISEHQGGLSMIEFAGCTRVGGLETESSIVQEGNIWW